MTKEHIVFYTGSLARGGAERVFLNLAEYFLKQGYRVSIITTYLAKNEYESPYASWREISKYEARELKERGENCEEVMYPDETPAYITFPAFAPDDAEHIRRYYSGLPVKNQTKSRVVNFIKRKRLLQEIITKLKPDILISTVAINNIMALLAARSTHTPVIIRCAANPSMEYPTALNRMFMRLTFRQAAGIVFQSESQRQLYPANIASRGRVIRNSLSEKYMIPRYEGDREKVITASGRLDTNKNHALLIRAFSALAEDFSDWRLIVYGEGPELENLRALAGCVNLRERINFPGYVNDLEKRLYKAGCYVMCSNEEGMPNALLEAMSLGLACISTDCPCGGPAELIADGVNGLLVPVGDEVALEKALRHVLSDSKKACEMGRKAMSVRDEYAPEAVNPKWEAYVREIISRNK